MLPLVHTPDLFSSSIVVIEAFKRSKYILLLRVYIIHVVAENIHITLGSFYFLKVEKQSLYKMYINLWGGGNHQELIVPQLGPARK